MAFPTLNKNEIIIALYNLIIGQQTFTDNVGGLDGSLVDRARMEGSMFGDTYLYQSADILRTYKFNPVDANSNGTVPDQANVLIQHVPTRINQQPITINVFRQIPITIERDLTKRAFKEEGAWSDFVNTLSSLLDETKKVYDVTTYNTFIGTHKANEENKQNQTVQLPSQEVGTPVDLVAYNKLVGETIAQKISDIFTELRDVRKDYNDLTYYRAYSPEDMVVIWNSEYVNFLKNLSLPEIFNSEQLKNVFDFANVMPAKYFGVVSDSGTAESGSRALEEMDLLAEDGETMLHFFAGEEVVPNAVVTPGTTYTNDDKIICKIMHRESVPYMSGFQTKTEFINTKALNTNHYLTFGHNELQHIKNYPYITLTAQEV